MTIVPDDAFDTYAPDEVAECWSGVNENLYEALWACVKLYKGPTPEESEEPCYGLNCVKDFWDRFTKADQKLLNKLAIRHRAEMEY